MNDKNSLFLNHLGINRSCQSLVIVLTIYTHSIQSFMSSLLTCLCITLFRHGDGVDIFLRFRQIYFTLACQDMAILHISKLSMIFFLQHLYKVTCRVTELRIKCLPKALNGIKQMK